MTPHIYYRCRGCGGQAYAEKTMRKHVKNCPMSGGRYVKLSKEVMQVEEKEEV